MAGTLTAEVSSQHRVLYVDDNEWNRIVFQRTVAPLVAIDAVTDAATALASLRARQYSVLVTDLRMPGMNGIDLCAVVRQEFPDVRRILVTAYGDLESAVDAINRGGVTSFMTKPWQPDFLLATLKEALHLVELRRKVPELTENLRRRDIELALGEAQRKTLHDLASIPLPLSSAVREMQNILQSDFASPVALKAALFAPLSTIREISGQLESMLRRSAGLELSAPNVSRYAASSALALARTLGTAESDLPIRVRIVDPDPTLEFEGDLTDVTRILLNLVHNARQALMEARTPDARVELRAVRVDDSVVFEVEDNGPGVPAHLRDVIFERGRTTRSDQGGSGLGLPICRQLAALNRAELTLEATEDGALFRLRLPAAEWAQ